MLEGNPGEVKDGALVGGHRRGGVASWDEAACAKLLAVD